MSASAIIFALASYGILAAVRVSACTGRISITAISGKHYTSLASCIAGEHRP